MLLVIAVLGAMATLAGSAGAYLYTRGLEEERAACRASRAVDSVQGRLSELELLARTVASVYLPADGMVPFALSGLEPWLFKGDQGIETRNHGIVAIAWLPVIHLSDLPAALGVLSRQGAGGPDLRDPKGNRLDPATLSGTFALVLDIEPKEIVGIAELGTVFDLEPTWRSAMMLAERSDSPVLVAPAADQSQRDETLLSLIVPVRSREHGRIGRNVGFLLFRFGVQQMLSREIENIGALDMYVHISGHGTNAATVYRSENFSSATGPQVHGQLFFGGQDLAITLINGRRGRYTMAVAGAIALVGSSITILLLVAACLVNWLRQGIRRS